jgi:beta-lactamase superfamily II metal-dependent hydrolase
MLRVHFLNVGHGDCTIIEHPSGRITMVDVNNGDELDDNSQSEILSELHYNRTQGLRRQPTLAEILAGSPSRSPTLGGLFGEGGLAQASRSAVPGLDLRGARSSHGGPGLGALTLLGRDKKQELREAGYKIGLTNPIDYFLRKFSGRPIFRYIQSHPDLDHMSGLAAMRNHGIEIVNFWDTEHSKIPAFKNEADKDEWGAYQQLRGSSSNPKVLRLCRGAAGAFWNEDPNGYDNHDGIEILSPTPEIVRAANLCGNWNNLSYVLRISYLGYRIVLGGDADTDVWEELVAHYGNDLRCDVLKASHHGRDSGYLASAVALMNPTYTVVSVGKKPDTDASNKYRKYCSNVWSTRWYGNLTLQISRERGIEWFAEYTK